MHYEKDILEVHERIKSVANQLQMKPIQLLLLKDDKWLESKRFAVRENSFYSQLQKYNGQIPVLVAFWKDIVDLIEEPLVKGYLKQQLTRNK